MWRVVFLKEIKDTIRDRRTMFSMIVFPIILMPVMFLGMSAIQKRETKAQQEHVAKIAIDRASVTTPLGSQLSKEPGSHLIVTDDPEQLIRKEKADVGLKIVPQGPGHFYPKVVVLSSSANAMSSAMGNRLTTFLKDQSQEMIKQNVRYLGVSEAVLEGISVEQKDVATKEEKSGFFLGLLIPLFLVMHAIAGGLYTAVDVSAGEKERKTLEALLLTPASKLNFVVGKFLAVSCTAMMSIVLSLCSLYLSLRFISEGELKIQIDAPAFGLLFAGGALLCVMFAAILVAVAMLAKSFKEGQNYAVQVYMFSLIPVVIVNVIQTFKPGPAFFLIPVVNTIMLFKEALVGKLDPAHIAPTFASLLFFSAVSVWFASRVFHKESILFRD
jgi:sodium transport system permease protein